MTTTKPTYLPSWLTLVRHAEGLRTLFERLEAEGGARSPPPRAWLTGRASEIGAVFTAIVRDWTEGNVDPREAHRRAALYLDELHRGARKWLGLGPRLACCRLDNALTIPLRIGATEALTRVFWRAQAQVERADTRFDPAAAAAVRVAPPVPRPSLRASGRGRPRPQGPEASLPRPPDPCEP